MSGLPTTTEPATLHARCERCDHHRMFNLGPINSADGLASTWSHLATLARTPCDECGATKWATSIRLGALTPVLATEPDDVLMTTMRTALSMSPLVLH